ncbi:MAG TPA: hypothetical protein PK961_16355 [bacterium]|nr:hypothetical protein [bacterium]
MTKIQDCYEKFSLLYRELVLRWFVKTELENKRVAQLSLLTDPKTFAEYYAAFLTDRGYGEKDRAEQVKAFLATEFAKFKRYLWQIHGEMFVAGIICDAGAATGKFLNQFRLTAAGEQSLAEQDPSPAFADQYLAELKKRIPALDTLVETYLAEALCSLNRQMPLASAMMLDAASERLFLLLVNRIPDSFEDAFKRTKRVLQVDASLVKLRAQFFQELETYQSENAYNQQRGLLPKDLNYKETHAIIWNTSEALRLDRSLGVPAEQGEVSMDTQRAALAIFPKYAERVYALLDFWKS